MVQESGVTSKTKVKAIPLIAILRELKVFWPPEIINHSAIDIILNLPNSTVPKRIPYIAGMLADVTRRLIRILGVLVNSYSGKPGIVVIYVFPWPMRLRQWSR